MSAPASYVRPGGDDPSLATINALIYSHPGEGKSVLWGSGGKDVLVMVSDPEGMISARSLGHTPHTVQVTDYEELQEVYEWLKEDKPKGFKWVVWDSLSLFQDRALMDDIMIDAVDKNPKQDPFVPSQREYLISMNRIGRYVRQFVELPYNFGISCLAENEGAEDGDGTLLMPMIQGKRMPSKICGYMNAVGFMHKRVVDGKKIQTIRWQPEGRVYAKDRFGGALGANMDRPTLPKIDAKIAEWRKAMKAKQAELNAALSAPALRSTTSTPAAPAKAS